MAPLSLKVVLDEGAVTRTILFDSAMKVAEAHDVIRDKLPTSDDGKDYGLFLTSANDDLSGIWLESNRTLDYYMLRENNVLYYLNKTRNLRVKLLDGSVRTLQVDQSKRVGDLMMVICDRIGITNHDEYGLCYEETEMEDVKDQKPTTGTLTLKRKAQTKEKDSLLEQMSKKLKTDDHVEWLDQHKTLREMGVDPKETLLLKRRFYYSDRNVDSRDPVQLNLLYVQTRDAVLEGRHPVTEAQAMEFAGIQCQIQYGDHQEEIHKPGLIENLKEYLPEQYSSSWGAEKKILKLHRKHQGLSQIDAKYLYIKTARNMPTYGVTFFLVKEKEKGKRKLVPRLLGINAESILRLDEVTKEILQVWPITHVKTYHTGKKETFTLNFGDYSDEEYTVKTNDAYRIREILEGYIDLIKKRLGAPYGGNDSESATIIQDNVQMSRGNIMTHVAHNPCKVVETSFIGPSRIIEEGQRGESSQGAQITTVQQMIITNKGAVQQQAVTGGVPLRSDMSQQFVIKLNRMNSNSVKVVTFLTDPTEENIKEARKIVEAMEADMPAITQGVKETAAKQDSEEARRKLLAELKELEDLVNGLSASIKQDNVNPTDVQDGASRIADLTTQMYFSLDPKTKRRSEFVRRSRQSFIQDEKTEKTLRRASYIAAAGQAAGNIDAAAHCLDQAYSGPALSPEEIQRLEESAVQMSAKLNAAVAQYITALQDPSNPDYSAAVTSLNTINELTPQLAQVAQKLSSTGNGEDRRAMLDDLHALCNAVREICALTGTQDQEKMQDAAAKYGDASGRLVYVFGRGNRKVNPDKENEIIDLSKDVGDRTTLLLMKANELTSMVETEPAAADVDEAGVRCADAARHLLLCAQLTAPTIYESHCQSALTAAAEGLSSSAQNLAATWKPLVEDPARHQMGEELKDYTMELARALDRLRNAYANLEDNDVVQIPQQPTPQQMQRLRFIASIGTAQSNMKSAEEDLDKPVAGPIPTGRQAEELKQSISQRMAQVNAAVASLMQAKSNPENPDYGTAELAMNTISELMPDLIRDTKVLSSTYNDRSRRGSIDDMKTWCKAINDVCASAGRDDAKELDDSAMRFGDASKKLLFVFSPRANKAREQLLRELSMSAHNKAMEMVDNSQKMADTLGGPVAARLNQCGNELGNAAAAFRTSVQITAPTIHEPRCQALVLSSTEQLSSSARELVSETQGLQDSETGCHVLDARLHQQRDQLHKQGGDLQNMLETIKATCKKEEYERKRPDLKTQRLKFITSAAAAKDEVAAAEELLKKPVSTIVANEEQTKDQLLENMSRVNAAVAALVLFKSDPNNVDYTTVDKAMEIIAKQTPAVIKDGIALSGASNKDARVGAVKDLRGWCDALRGICACAAGDDEDMDANAQKYATTANKLGFTFKLPVEPHKEQQVLKVSQSAWNKAQQLVKEAKAVAQGIGGAAGTELEYSADQLDSAAKALHTIALLSAPTIQKPYSKSSIHNAACNLVASAWRLNTKCHEHPQCKRLAKQIDTYMDGLQKDEQELGDVCHGDALDIEDGDPSNPASSRQIKRLKFITSSCAARSKLAAAEKSLAEPTPLVPLKESEAKDLQKTMSEKMALVNAAIAALLQARCDTDKPDYKAANEAMKTIAEVMPGVINDSKTLSSTCKDDAERRKAVEDMRKWCRAIRDICASAEHDTREDLEGLGQQYANASNKLMFVFHLPKSSDKEKGVIQLSESACGDADQMLRAALAAAEALDGAAAEHLADRARVLDDAAKALRTTALLTASCIDEPQCQTSLLNSTEKLSASAQDLISEAKGYNHPLCKKLASELDRYMQNLEKTAKGLRDICKDAATPESPEVKKQRLKFIASTSAAQGKISAAEELLDQPVSVMALKENEAKDLQNKLSEKMSLMNAAVAALLRARCDPEKPDYNAAEKAMNTITELMPAVIKDSKTLSDSTCKDDASRANGVKDLRGWCDAVRGICACAAGDNYDDLTAQAQRYAGSSNKLTYAFSPRLNPGKEQQVLQLSRSACDRAQQMVGEARAADSRLTRRANHLDDAAKALHTTALLTASSIHEPQSQSSLLNSASNLSTSAQGLISEAKRHEHPQCSRLAEELDRYMEAMEKAVKGLKEACQDGGRQGKPPPPVRKGSLSKESRPAPPPPLAVKPVQRSANARHASQEFLQHLQQEESRNRAAMPSQDKAVISKKLHEEISAKAKEKERLAKKAEDERLAKKLEEEKLAKKAEEERLLAKKLEEERLAKKAEEERLLAKKLEEERLAKKAEEENKKRISFEKTLDEANKAIHKAEEDLKKVCSAKVSTVPPLDDEKVEELQQQLERKLAAAGAAAATLLASSNPESIDYTKSSDSVRKLSELMPDIAKDATLLSNTRDEAGRRALLERIQALFAATRRLCAAAGASADGEKLNEATVEFGDQYARLFYVCSSEADPAQEKGVIERARAIGESGTRLAVRAAGLAPAAARGKALYVAGNTCAGAAAALLYTAKLIAPSIHHPECKNSLITAAKEVSSTLEPFKATWQPLSSDPEHAKTAAELTKEADELEKLLEAFRQDLGVGRLVRRRHVEKIVVEDTELRQLASKILESAKTRAECINVSEAERRKFAEYANKLTAAIKALDVANHRCRRSPHDINKRRDLDNEIQNLQVILLQERPALGDKPQNNIVDVTEYVRDVSADAEKMTKAAYTVKVTTGKPAVEGVKQRSEEIHHDAHQILNPTQQNDDTDALADMWAVDHFGQSCDTKVQEIMSLIQSIEEEEAKDKLHDRAVPLADSCNMMRFAVKSALSTAVSAALDSTLEDLGELEKRIDRLLIPSEEATPVTKRAAAPASLVAARAGLAGAAAALASGGAGRVPPALHGYVAELRGCAGSPPAARLKEHVNKVLQGLKLLTATAGTQVAMWQPPHSTQLATITQEIIKELENPDIVGSTDGKSHVKVLNESDVAKLLLPAGEVKLESDRARGEEKLQHTAMKLTCLSGLIVQSASKPESLSRSVHTVIDGATELANTARSLKTNSSAQNDKIEEAAQEMCFATYNLLKTSELVAQEPNNSGHRRRLLDACRLLNDSINKLTRVTSTSSHIQKDCNELARSLQTQQNVLHSSAPINSMPYSDCMEALQQQIDVIHKLKSDERMSRDQFRKTLNYVSSAVCNSTEYSTQCAYLLSISEQHKELCTSGVPDVARVHRAAQNARECCLRIVRTSHINQVRDEDSQLKKQVEELKQALKETASSVKVADVKRELTEGAFRVGKAANTLHDAIQEDNASIEKISSLSLGLIDVISSLGDVTERAAHAPEPAAQGEARACSDDVMAHTKKLIAKTQGLVKEVGSHEDVEPMTWVMFNRGRTGVLEAFEALLNSIRQNGQRTGLVEQPKAAEVEKDDDAPKKSYIQIQVELANKWLQRRPSRSEVQTAGERAAWNIIGLAGKMMQDLKGQDKEELEGLITDSEKLVTACSAKYDSNKASSLMEKLRELRKAIERGVVCRVVEDFLEAEKPLEDLDTFADVEKDEARRKFLLEKKIAELMAQLGRVTRTARFVADASAATPTVSQELKTCSDQTELLAPMLVKAAQERVSSPEDPKVVENYKAMLARYTDLISKVRDLCDQAVDPMEFVQTAGETMERMREESSKVNDPQRCAYTSNAITRLANRVIDVSLSSVDAHSDPELRAALRGAQERLRATVPTSGTRASRLPDWRDTTAEILRTTGEVESALGGETIFKKQPEPDQPIYMAALNLHEEVRGWSARDNEIVAVAKRMAVLMARLSDYMNTDRKRELIFTSKSIVTESHEVSRLAKKLALECTDIRIKTNLEQVCDRIPTISGQLKMLTTVKGSSFGQQGSDEDKEAMNTLVTNAQNLMTSVQEVVKAAASASVKIASQRGGPRIRWVRRNY